MMVLCQALVNPLSVARKSPKQDRREAAKKLMNDMEQHSSGLVQVIWYCTQCLLFFVFFYAFFDQKVGAWMMITPTNAWR